MPPADLIPVDAQRLENRIAALAEIGATPGGGVHRVAFSDTDREGREHVASLMRAAGLEVRIDAAANLIGRREGSDPALPPILFGSHTDTVPNGGRFDGALGVLAALEVVETLNDHDIATRHPLEVISFTDEEGGLTGSRAFVGTISAETLDAVGASGLTVRDGIGAVGGAPEQLHTAVRRTGDFAAFLELHIEQGEVLESRAAKIGVVTGFVGIRRWQVTVEGVANHAGTTRMERRRDALVAAAHFVLAVQESAVEMAGEPVATVGVLRTLPGAANVVPGRVEMVLEIRDLDGSTMDALFGEIRSRATEIAARTATTIDIAGASVPAEPIHTDPQIQTLIRAAASDLDLQFEIMPSGAGHDAQNLARIAPTGMIFVPSVGGISHSPEEFTRTEDVANGTNVLLHTILRIDAGVQADTDPAAV
jgi:N-carbamoyl-L-amino-acid hydrolase